MKFEVTPVVFKNRDGLRLFGILHRPEDARSDVCVIILSPGIKSRVAPHRLYVKMAKRFCELGFCTLRFDPHGIGDSEGEIEEKMVADFYGSIQVGRFVKDTIDAMDWMEKEHGISSFILSGLCGGAITGLLAGSLDKRTHSLLALGIPVTLDSAVKDQSKYMTRGQLEVIRGSYFNKLLDLKSWVRFLSLKSDFSLIYRSIFNSIKRKSRHSQRENPATLQKKEDQRVKPGEDDDNFNPYFPQALHGFLSNRKILLIFSEADKLFWEFEEKYIVRYKNEFKSYKKKVQIFVVKDANHIFSFKEWEEEMIKKSSEWIMNTKANLEKN